VAEDSPRIIDGELQRFVESWKESQKKALEKSSSLIQKQTPAYSDVRHDWNFKGD